MHDHIKCRGKRLDTGGWIDGYFIKRQWDGINCVSFIVEDRVAVNGFKSLFHPVHNDSIGMWSGFESCDDVTKVYQGDICQRHKGEPLYVMMWDLSRGMFYLYNGHHGRREASSVRVMTILGNTTESLNLLK